MVGLLWHSIENPTSGCAGETAEIVALAKIVPRRHALEGGSFCCQLPDVGASNLPPIFVQNPYSHRPRSDVSINRERRRQGAYQRPCHAARDHTRAIITAAALPHMFLPRAGRRLRDSGVCPIAGRSSSAMLCYHWISLAFAHTEVIMPTRRMCKRLGTRTRRLEACRRIRLTERITCLPRLFRPHRHRPRCAVET